MKIAIFLPNWVGDVVMATPALRAMRCSFGNAAEIVGILRPNLGELLAGTDFLDAQWYFDPRAGQSEFCRLALVKRMRRQRFDLALLLTHSFHTALLAWLGGARRRLGYARDGRGMLLDDKLYPQRVGGRIAMRPNVDEYLDLAEAAGCTPESPRMELAVTEAEEAQAEVVWKRLGLRTDGRVIALNSSGAFGGAKLWPAEHFAALARQIVEKTDHDALVICGPNEREIARAITAGADHPRVFSLAEQAIGLGLTKACMGRSRLAVTTDSGPRHIAAALGKPVVTLLGPTNPILIANPTVRGVCLQLDIPCKGCYQRVCPLGHHRCMRDLSPNMVFAAIGPLLREEATAAA